MCLRFMERLEDLTEAGATSSSRLTRTRPISALPRGRKSRLEVGPEKAGPPRLLLSACQTAPPGRGKGQNLKWTVKSVQPSP